MKETVGVAVGEQVQVVAGRTHLVGLDARPQAQEGVPNRAERAAHDEGEGMKRKSKFEARLTFRLPASMTVVNQFGTASDARWRSDGDPAITAWPLELCQKGPWEWFHLPADCRKFDLVVSTDRSHGYELRHGVVNCWVQSRGEVVGFYTGMRRWLLEQLRRAGGRQLWVSIEVDARK